MDNPFLGRIWSHAHFHSITKIFMPSRREINWGFINLRPNSRCDRLSVNIATSFFLSLSMYAILPFSPLASGLAFIQRMEQSDWAYILRSLVAFTFSHLKSYYFVQSLGFLMNHEKPYGESPC